MQSDRDEGVVSSGREEFEMGSRLDDCMMIYDTMMTRKNEESLHARA